MLRYLVALVWPAGLALILGIAYVLAKRAPADPVADGRAAPRDGGRHGHRSLPGGQRAAAVGSARFIVLAAAGSAVVYGVMYLLGLAIVHHGLAIDKPIYTWITHHQSHALAALMKRLTKIGNTWTTWGAAGAAAACLAVTFRSRRWLPPVAFATVIVLDHVTTLALRHTFHRLGPPISPLGTYPSGGCDRILVFYGLIAYLLWREFSGRRRAAVWTSGAIACMAFTEAFSRVYLGLHWFTDAVSGVLYGGLLLIVFIAAIQVASGRSLPFAGRRAAGRPATAAPDRHLAGDPAA